MRYRSAMLLATTALMPVGVPVAANSAPPSGPQLQVGGTIFRRIAAVPPVRDFR